MDDIFEPPVSMVHFQRELDAACKDRSIQLRLEWAPRLTVAKVVEKDGRTRVYRKYPLLGVGRFEHYILGWHYKRFIRGKWRIVAYQKQGGLIPGTVRETDLAVPDHEKINHSIQIFVIEKKLPDEYARSLHEQKRQISRERSGFDLFGAFPTEGIWDWWAYVSEHRDNCCELAGRIPCYGLYREPSQWDLDRVARELKALDEVAGKDPAMLIEQGARDITAELERQDYDDTIAMLDLAREHDPDLLRGESQVGFTKPIGEPNVNATNPSASA